jgi:hypothetical protein
MNAFSRLIARVAGAFAPEKAAAHAVKMAKEGDWALMEAMIPRKDATVRFASWADAQTAFSAWAQGAPGRLCLRFANAKALVGDEATLLDARWWPSETPEPFEGAGLGASGQPARTESAEQEATAQEEREGQIKTMMALRLALLSRGAGWLAIAKKDERGAREAAAMIAEPDGWAAQAFEALFGPNAMSLTALAGAQIITKAGIGNTSKMSELLRGRKDPRSGIVKIGDEEIIGATEEAERGVAMTIGVALAKAGRGDALGAIRSAAAGRRPVVLGQEREQIEAFAGRVGEAWQDAWRQLEGGAKAREACLFWFMASGVDHEAMSQRGLTRVLVSEREAQRAWMLGERCWGAEATTLAWPANINAGAFGAQMTAQREAMELGATLSAQASSKPEGAQEPESVAEGHGDRPGQQSKSPSLNPGAPNARRL